MEIMVVGRGGFEVALRDAARGYMRRFGRLPDRVIVREGTEAPELVQLEGEGGQVKAEVVRCKWMREGDVGVFVKVSEEIIHEEHE